MRMDKKNKIESLNPIHKDFDAFDNDALFELILEQRWKINELITLTKTKCIK